MNILVFLIGFVLCYDALKGYNKEKSNYGDVHVAREYLKHKFRETKMPFDINTKEEHFYFFSLHDYNEDHHLDGHELRVAFSGFELIEGVEDEVLMPLETIQEMIDHLLLEDDEDNDGKISWEEYLKSQYYHHNLEN